MRPKERFPGNMKGVRVSALREAEKSAKSVSNQSGAMKSVPSHLNDSRPS